MVTTAVLPVTVKLEVDIREHITGVGSEVKINGKRKTLRINLANQNTNTVLKLQ